MEVYYLFDGKFPKIEDITEKTTVRVSRVEIQDNGDTYIWLKYTGEIKEEDANGRF